MGPRLFTIPAFVAVVYLSGGIQSQNDSFTNNTAVNDTDDGNKTKIRPYDKFHTIEIIRAQLLKKTTLNTVCQPKVPAKGDEIVITDMTTGSRGDPNNGNFQFDKYGQDHTFDEQTELIENTVVATLNECIGKCTSNKDCLTYAYEDQTKACKLAKTCTPSLAPATDSMVFTMSYWYQM